MAVIGVKRNDITRLRGNLLRPVTTICDQRMTGILMRAEDKATAVK